MIFISTSPGKYIVPICRRYGIKVEDHFIGVDIALDLRNCRIYVNQLVDNMALNQVQTVSETVFINIFNRFIAAWLTSRNTEDASTLFTLNMELESEYGEALPRPDVLPEMVTEHEYTNAPTITGHVCLYSNEECVHVVGTGKCHDPRTLFIVAMTRVEQDDAVRQYMHDVPKLGEIVRLWSCGRTFRITSIMYNDDRAPEHLAVREHAEACAGDLNEKTVDQLLDDVVHALEYNEADENAPHDNTLPLDMIGAAVDANERAVARLTEHVNAGMQALEDKANKDRQNIDAGAFLSGQIIARVDKNKTQVADLARLLGDAVARISQLENETRKRENEDEITSPVRTFGGVRGALSGDGVDVFPVWIGYDKEFEYSAHLSVKSLVESKGVLHGKWMACTSCYEEWDASSNKPKAGQAIDVFLSQEYVKLLTRIPDDTPNDDTETEHENEGAHDGDDTKHVIDSSTNSRLDRLERAVPVIRNAIDRVCAIEEQQEAIAKKVDNYDDTHIELAIDNIMHSISKIEKQQNEITKTHHTTDLNTSSEHDAASAIIGNGERIIAKSATAKRVDVRVVTVDATSAEHEPADPENAPHAYMHNVIRESDNIEPILVKVVKFDTAPQAFVHAIKADDTPDICGEYIGTWQAVPSTQPAWLSNAPTGDGKLEGCVVQADWAPDTYVMLTAPVICEDVKRYPSESEESLIAPVFGGAEKLEDVDGSYETTIKDIEMMRAFIASDLCEDETYKELKAKTDIDNPIVFDLIKLEVYSETWIVMCRYFKKQIEAYENAHENAEHAPANPGHVFAVGDLVLCAPDSVSDIIRVIDIFSGTIGGKVLWSNYNNKGRVACRRKDCTPLTSNATRENVKPGAHAVVLVGKKKGFVVVVKDVITHKDFIYTECSSNPPIGYRFKNIYVLPTN